MGKNEFFRFDRMREAGQKLPFLRITVFQKRLCLREMFQLLRIDPAVQAHLPEQACFPALDISLQQPVIFLRPHRKDLVPVVPVAAEHLHVSLFAQFHQEMQGVKAGITSFEEISVHNQKIFSREGRFPEHPLQIGKIPVDI